jgi:hypothetical protein
MANNDDEETKLDSDIQESQQELENLEHPEELELNTGVNDEILTKMVEKIKKMPRDGLLNLINNLAKSNNLPPHEFSSVSSDNLENSKIRLRQKIQDDTNKRTNKFGSKPITTLNSKPSASKTQSKQVEVVPSPVSSSSASVSVEQKPKLSKNQKKRLRQKNAKLSGLGTDPDVVLQDDEVDLVV